VYLRRDKLVRESISTTVVESTLANVISSCLEGSTTRKLGKVWPAAHTMVHTGSVAYAWFGDDRKREVTRERERETTGNIRVRGCIMALMATNIKHPCACTLDHGRLQCHYLC